MRANADRAQCVQSSSSLITIVVMTLFFLSHQDDANHDPQWSEEQILAAHLTFAGLTIGRHELDIISKTTIAVFEILERAWATQDCALIDMKIEFGVDTLTGLSGVVIMVSQNIGRK